jgi:dTDP-4-amino-4,6-dideoxygalactose transaminase
MSSTPTRQIPILDLKPEIDSIWPQLSEAIERTIRSGQFILGPETQMFEKEIASFLGVKHAIGLNSGTDALVIGLRAAGIQPGDEVITTPFSFFATAESISNVGAKPVFVDVDLDSMNINADLIEAAITDKTKAIMPVHLFGRCAPMNKIMAIAQKYNLQVIEDCAQSFGSTYQACAGCSNESCKSSSYFGKQSGTIGILGAYSFFPTKNLGCYGDGGLIATDDDAIAEMSRKLRAHGSIKKYQNEILGYNSRLDSVQAAILRIKLPLIPGYNESRRAVAQRYWDAFVDLDGIVPPAVVPGHVFHQYTVRILNGKRDAVQAKLQEMGIGTMIYYPIPQDRLPVYAGQYPVNEQNEILSQQVLSLPIWPQLDNETQDHVISCVKQAIQSA